MIIPEFDNFGAAAEGEDEEDAEIADDEDDSRLRGVK